MPVPVAPLDGADGVAVLAVFGESVSLGHQGRLSLMSLRILRCSLGVARVGLCNSLQQTVQYQRLSNPGLINNRVVLQSSQ